MEAVFGAALAGIVVALVIIAVTTLIGKLYDWAAYQTYNGHGLQFFFGLLIYAVMFLPMLAVRILAILCTVFLVMRVFRN